MSTLHNSMKKNKLNAGFSIIEILIAVVLISIGALASLSFISEVTSSQRKLNQYSGRNSINSKIIQLTSSAATLYWSAAGGPATSNIELKRCVLGNVGGTCQGDQVWRDFQILIPITPDLGSRGFGAATPLLYNAKTLQPCTTTTPSEQCPFDVRTQFRALCANRGILGSTTTCQTAESIEIRYQITQVWNGTSGEELKLRDRAGTVSVSNREISLFKAQDFTTAGIGVNLGCEPGQVAIGYSGTGQIICQKLDHLCPPGTIAVGVDEFGRPVNRSLSTENLGEYFNDSGVAKVRCISTNCGTSEMVGMVMGGNGNPYAAMCATGSATCSTSDAQVLVDIRGDGPDADYMGDPLCATLQSCKNPNPNGLDMSQLNFTRSFTQYNAPIPANAPLVGGVVSVCEPFGCGLNQYMTSWTPQGNCFSSVAPPACIENIWTPDPSTQCNGVSFTQTSNCATTRTATGTRVGPPCSVCVPGPWTPNANTQCTGLNVVQTNGCASQIVPGTQVCSTPTPAPTATPPPAITPPPATCAGGESGVLSVSDRSTTPPGSCAGFFPVTTNPATTNVGPCTAATATSMTAGEYCTYLSTEDPVFGVMCNVVWFEACPVMPPTATCGTSSGSSFAAAPSSNLCANGTASAVTGTGPWNWTCTSGATSASCSANLTATPAACGAANGTTVSTAPTTGLCSSGTPTTVLGGGPWNWSCVSGASVLNCSANATPLPPASCNWGRPAAWSPPPPLNFTCVEFFVPPGGGYFSTLAHGVTQTMSYNYCVGMDPFTGLYGQVPCYGTFDISCNNGVMTFSNEICNFGIVP